MAERSELALTEEAGMRAVPDTGGEPWVTRLKAPHPAHVSMVAGALLTVTSSRQHAYMIACTLDDAGLLVRAALRPEGHSGQHTNKVGWSEPVADTDLRARFAQILGEDVTEFMHPDEFGGYDIDYGRLAEIAHEFFAPTLAAHTAEIERLTYELFPLVDLPRQLKKLRGLTRAIVADLAERADEWANAFGTGEGAPGPEFHAIVDKYLPGLRQLIARRAVEGRPATPDEPICSHEPGVHCGRCIESDPEFQAHAGHDGMVADCSYCDPESAPATPTEPRVWRKGDRVVCAPDVERKYPGTITGFNDWGQPLVKWDHWHKVDTYSPGDLSALSEVPVLVGQLLGPDSPELPVESIVTTATGRDFRRQDGTDTAACWNEILGPNRFTWASLALFHSPLKVARIGSGVVEAPGGETP